MTSFMTSEYEEYLPNPKLKAYLEQKQTIRPFWATLRDPVVANNVVNIVTTLMLIPSGMTDTLENGQGNFWRTTQGVAGSSNLSWQFYLQVKGRYQTYCDLRDLQAGVDPALIITRKDEVNPSQYGRFESWWMANSVNMTAGFAIGMSGLMAISGVVSGRPGEAATALMFIPGLALRFLPEPGTSARVQYDKNLQEAKNTPVFYRTTRQHAYYAGHVLRMVDQKVITPFFKSIFNMAAKKLGSKIVFGADKAITENAPPLMLSAVYTGARRIPALVNAILVVDLYQIVHMGGGFLSDITLAEVNKGYMGRRHGSIVNGSDGDVAARSMLEGRVFKPIREYFRPPET
jgi:hypothetical protein